MQLNEKGKYFCGYPEYRNELKNAYKICKSTGRCCDGPKRDRLFLGFTHMWFFGYTRLLLYLRSIMLHFSGGKVPRQ